MGSPKHASPVVTYVNSPGFQARTKTETSNSSKRIPWCKYLCIILFFIATGLLFHPKLLNIRIPFLRYASNSEVPLNYVEDFYLWTRNTKENPERIIVGVADDLSKTYFRRRSTYVLIPGFLCTGFEDWIINMKNELLKKKDCNVVSVNWSSGSRTIGYYVIQERVPYVGEDVAALLTFLMSENLDIKYIHLIGHSLGSHIAGFAGKALSGKLPRISGLDPAGVGYWGVSKNKRLDKEDALFVDIIHTNGCYTIINQWTDCYGIYENIGHVDFYPNGGERQPACIDGDGGKFVEDGRNCDHGLAYAYFTESIGYSPTNTLFAARKCDNYEEFINKTCTYEHPIQYMGFYAEPGLNGSYFLNTSNVSPYALLDSHFCPREYSLLRILGFLVGLFIFVCAFLKVRYGYEL